MKLIELFNIFGSKKKKTRVGRGMSSGTGKTSRRGVKGQKARSGVAIKGFEGGQMPVIKRLPKRGFVSRNKISYSLVNIAAIEELIDNKKLAAKDEINLDLLKKVGLIRKSAVRVKLLNGKATVKNLKFTLNACSENAKKSIESLGGSVNII